MVFFYSDFNFFDFFQTLTEFLALYKSFYLHYVESPYFVVFEDQLQIYLKSLPDNLKVFSFHDNGLFVFSPDSISIKNLIRNFKEKFFGLSIRLKEVKIKISKLPSDPHMPLISLFYKLNTGNRYLTTPEEIKNSGLIDRILQHDKVIIDLDPESKYFPLNFIKASLKTNVKLYSTNGKWFLKFPNNGKLKIVQLITDRDSPEIQLNKLSISTAQRLLESYFLTPLIKKEVLEFLIYHSIGKYELFLAFLDFGVKNNVFEWNPHSGWHLNRENVKLLDEIYPMSRRDYHEKLNESEKLIFYTLITSGHELELKDLFTAIGEIKAKVFNNTIMALERKKLILCDNNKILTKHPAINEILDGNFEKNKIHSVHKKLANILTKKKMSGVKIPSWHIARHLELAGDHKLALKFYLDAIEEDINMKNYDRALEHLERGMILCKGSKKKNDLLKLKADILLKKYQLKEAFVTFQEIEKCSGSKEVLNGDYHLKKAMLLIELGKPLSAMRTLKTNVPAINISQCKALILEARASLLTETIKAKLLNKINSICKKNTNNEVKRIFFELLGDISLYQGKIQHAIESYEKSLKFANDPMESIPVELKLCFTLFQSFEFHKAFYLLEKVLWQVNEIKNPHLKSKILNQILSFYIATLPPDSVEKFFRVFLEEDMRTPGTVSQYYKFFALFFLKKGLIHQALHIFNEELRNLKLNGNLYTLNQLLIHVTTLLIRSGELNLAESYLLRIHSNSNFINLQKRLCELLLSAKRGLEIEQDEIRELALANGVNTLIFNRITEDWNSPNIEAIKPSIISKINTFRSILKELDFLTE